MSSKAADYKAWIEKADSDLLNIQNNINGRQVPWDTVCFHAQQAAEKLLKAVLVFHGQIPPKTHDLLLLQKKCLNYEPELSSLEGDLQLLDSYSETSRYLGDYIESIEEEDGLEAVEAAKRIRVTIQAKFPSR
ncbi:MAG: HEPN domain-containing protein [Myxococcales bacterium]|nr:MAG: HEPN domain-containing protein [Myxococcales bacterium]